ncbi:predicted protein [Nematostella vectensis]|uniref:SUEL-type lectin domain-containing protein n=1 Tax=Nematostella vectensis TaxID=45351 RepID=A7S2S7_NEMVE|nr:predicted protein [Nematostella vectensis]|eukprot:XP_001634040.1 predicted protein [Nematostella vectensis]
MAPIQESVNVLFAGFVFLLSAKAAFGAENIEYQNAVTCEGNNLSLRCVNASYGIVIHRATYGRTKQGKVVCNYQGSEGDYQYFCGENDVTRSLNYVCGKNKKKCEARVGKTLFGSPCGPGITKAYLTVIYSCVKRKRKKRPKTTIRPEDSTPSTQATLSTLRTLTTSNGSSVNNTFNNASHVGGTSGKSGHTTHASTVPTSQAIPDDNVVLGQRGRGKSDVFLSIIMWFIFVKDNFTAFMKVFMISMATATGIFTLLFAIFSVRSYLRARRKETEVKLNGGPLHITHTDTVNTIRECSKDMSDPDTNSFPPPPPALAPLPDDVIYPSPTSTISCSRPPPPPKRGYSTDDMGRMGLDTPKYKHAPLQRSISLRTKENYAKELRFEKLPDIDGYRDIQAVIIQRNNGSTMYMNPMYENGVLVREAKM